jgi:hypothetical protein
MKIMAANITANFMAVPSPKASANAFGEIVVFSITNIL